MIKYTYGSYEQAMLIVVGVSARGQLSVVC